MSRPAEPTPLAPPPSPVDVGVVAALPMEIGYLTDKLSGARKFASRGLTVIEGELEGRLLAVIASGMGRESAAKGVAHLIAGHRPRLIVSAGFAGALDPSLDRNDLAAPAALIDGRGEVLSLDRSLTEPIAAIRKVGPMLLVDRVITEAAEKARLRENHGADLIDMESLAVGLAARDVGVHFLSLRVVSDDARTSLPPEIGRLLNTSGSYRVGAALRALWTRPSALKDFHALHAHAMEAADRLSDGLQVVLRGLS